MERIRVNVSKPYDVLVGRGLISEAPRLIGETVKSRRTAVISDSNVFPIYGEKLCADLRSEGFEVDNFVFPAGEASKNAETYVKILNFLAGVGLTREDTVIALGGGVVGDISGFAAATFLRGIKYIQMPTTLLSAVDSSVGGKCAIDLDAGKNLAGAFHQPSLVICDPDALGTLPREYFLDGCGEVLKYGVLDSAELLSHISEKGAELECERIISQCISIKAEIVSADEFDRGRRALLNLGHTTAHAIEKLSHFGVSHGSAVATGCAIAARASFAAGFCSKETANAVCEAVVSLGHSVTTDYTAEELTRVMMSDKKRRGNVVDFVTVHDIGDCRTTEIEIDGLTDFVRHGL